MTTTRTSGAADANYHLIDRFLRNNLYDDDYAEYSAALDALASTTAQPVAQQGAADGFFLLLPQRPKPEAPAGTAGLDWDAYSGAQMLAFGRDCSDAAIAALRTQQPAPATQQAGERVYAFRRKGLADFCTCDEARYEELSNKPHLFETRIFYTAPQPVAREPLSHAQAKALVLKYGNDPLNLVFQVELAHGIKGGQHGTE